MSNEIDSYDNKQYVNVSGYDNSKKVISNGLTESLDDLIKEFDHDDK